MRHQFKGKAKMPSQYSSSSSASPRNASFPLYTFLKYFAIFVAGFYCGGILTYQYTSSSNKELESTVESLLLQNQQVDVDALERHMAAKCKEEISKLKLAKNDYDGHDDAEKRAKTDEISKAGRENDYLSDASITGKLVRGITKIDRQEFMSNFDYGTPNDGLSPVLIIHHGANSLPTSHPDSEKLSNSIVPMSVSDAAENCDFMHVFTVPKYKARMCTAMVENFENWHVQKWMRQKPEGGGLDPTQPLRVVNRPMTEKGRRTFKVPDAKMIKKNWEILERYFRNFDSVVEELKPIAEKVAVKNTIIVMTCNMGQSELLMNFVCNARSKGLDVSNVLVFPTDQETKDLAEGLGLATFHDEKNFGHLPKGEARHYADKTFTAMMFAKVVCVQMINHLGYDLLFQDVDVVWNKNPLEYFHDPENKFHDFDMYFQDDGAHSRRYAPYSANSGFYYVRNNYETRYFFVSLLYAGDLILVYNSHQEPLIQIMTEHASQYRLKVKVLDREMDEFPGGWHFNSPRKKAFMKKIAKGEVDNYIFHMSWTNNKTNKIKYFQQMGEWYISDVCVQKTRATILEEKAISGEQDGDQAGVLMQPCCLAEPQIVCHYRDKPSKIPCTDSPPIDKNKRSFW